MIIMPGQSVTIGVELKKQPDGSGDPIVPVQGEPIGWQIQDISRVFGKYQCTTMQWGLWYSDEDFVEGAGCGPLKWGAVPAPGSLDRRPWRGVIVELIRRAMGAPRE